MEKTDMMQTGKRARAKSAILITYRGKDAYDEAMGLCDAAGYHPIHVIRQKHLRRPTYGIGSGTLEALKEMVEEANPEVIIYDEILKPSQNYNLASATHREILDRETLILEIFESRASSAESKLQVKLAQLRYEMARAKERVRLSSMGEQPGFMGIGKFGVDVYYNDIRNRMKSTREKLEKSGRQRELHRRSRKRAGFRMVSLAGYTSAGKTTLFNKMTGESNQRGEEMFTTLSTTTRKTAINECRPITTTKAEKKEKKYAVPCTEVLISDTVGFISKLPAYMIDAFRSTLEELGHADVIVLVVDIAEETHTARKKLASCHAALGELGIGDEHIIYALNKSDLAAISSEHTDKKAEGLGIRDGKRTVRVSALTGSGIAELKEHIRDVIKSGGAHNTLGVQASRRGAGDADRKRALLLLQQQQQQQRKTTRKRDIGWSKAKEEDW